MRGQAGYTTEIKIDGAAVSLTYREGRLRHRRHPGQRRDRRGRHRQPPDGPRRAARAHGERVIPAPDGDPGRGLLHPGRLCPAQRRARAGWRAPLRQPAERGGREPPPARSRDHPEAPAAALRLPRRGHRRRPSRPPRSGRRSTCWQPGASRWSRTAPGTRTWPRSSARWTEYETLLPTLPFGADGVVIKIDRLSLHEDLGIVGGREPRWAVARKFAPEVAVTRRQGDPGQRGPDRRPQPLGRARTGGDRRGHRLQRDAPQRGADRPEGHPRGRLGGDHPGGRGDSPGDRAAARPAGRRRAAFQDAVEVPGLRHPGREGPRGGDAVLPQRQPAGTGARGHRPLRLPRSHGHPGAGLRAGTPAARRRADPQRGGPLSAAGRTSWSSWTGSRTSRPASWSRRSRPPAASRCRCSSSPSESGTSGRRWRSCWPVISGAWTQLAAGGRRDQISGVAGVGPTIAEAVVSFFHNRDNRAAGPATSRPRPYHDRAPGRDAGGALAGQAYVLTGTLPTLSRPERPS